MGGALQEPLSQVLGQQTRGAGAEAPRSRVPESLPPWAVRTSLLCLLLRGFNISCGQRNVGNTDLVPRTECLLSLLR